jgi:transposase
MPAGRPTKYDPAMCAIVIAAGEDGETLAGMAEACDVDRETINNWMDAHPEFSRAVKRGLQRAQVWWERQGKLGTFGGVKDFNATSYIFQMKNRFRADWNDTVKTDHTSSDGTMTPHVIERVIVQAKPDGQE